MTTLVSSTLECEIYHILPVDIELRVLTNGVDISYPGSEYNLAFKFNSTELDCELEINETFEADNRFKLVVWNIPYAKNIVINDTIKLAFYWNSNKYKQYYAICIIDKVENPISNGDNKTTIEGIFIVDDIFKRVYIEGLNSYTNALTITNFIHANFGLEIIDNLPLKEWQDKSYFVYLVPIAALLDRICAKYNYSHLNAAARWYISGNSLILEDSAVNKDAVEFLLPIVQYSDIINYKIVEISDVGISVEIEISGLPSLKKESYLTIDYANSAEFFTRDITFDIIKQLGRFTVTEVVHKIGTSTGFYTTVYCQKGIVSDIDIDLEDEEYTDEE